MFKQIKIIYMFLFILLFFILFCLPVYASDYDELNYLSINSTSFTTDYKPNNNSRFVLDADLGGFVSWTNVLGDGSTIYIQTNLGDGDNVAYTYAWNSVFVGRNYRGLAGRHVIDINKGILTVDNDVVATSTNTGTFSSSSFFGLNNNSGMFRISKFNVYSLKIYENDVLVRDYIPVINNSEYGFYDNVNNNFISVSGSTGDIALSLHLSVSTTDETVWGPTIYTQSFDDFIINNYKMYIKYPLEDGTTSDFVNFNLVGTITDDNKYSFWATKNGTYTFKLHDENDNYIASSSITITNVISSIGGLEDSSVVLPRLSVHVLNGGTDLASIVIRTQSFPIEQKDKYKCVFWTSSGIGTAQFPFNVTQIIEGNEFYFEQTVSNLYDKDTYFFKFFDTELEKYSGNVSLTVDREYVLSNSDLYDDTPFWLKFIKDLFIPSDNYFSNIQETLLSDLKTKLPYQDYINMFSTLIDVGTDGQMEDISIDNYKVGTLNINLPNFIDFSYITQYRDTWYAWVRGFVFIFLIIYHINQINKFLRGFNITDGALSNAGIGGDKK